MKYLPLLLLLWSCTEAPAPDYLEPEYFYGKWDCYHRWESDYRQYNFNETHTLIKIGGVDGVFTVYQTERWQVSKNVLYMDGIHPILSYDLDSFVIEDWEFKRVFEL